ncbi:MAG: ORF6N domain-containing protein [Candidatus Delongbacteria bacterium]|jgi:phage regulator Rha-like protein|nr:ORF6N domain-containing protein [Candidatus Delongbacteria bacterium]
MQKNEIEEFNELNLKNKIYSIRGYQVMLDRDLAELYSVETRVLNQAVKRNKERFPKEFCFLMNNSEVTKWRSQIVMSNNVKIGLRWKPYAFTQEGVAMLAGVLKSEIAVKMSIQIIKAFVEMRKFLMFNAQIFQRLENTETKLLEHDRNFDKVFTALETHEDIPKQGVFFDGQIFDAYNFISKLFKSAKESVTIIDNYIDNSVLLHLTEVGKNVKVNVLTRSISEKLKQDIEKFEDQYFSLNIKVVKNYHDRFIIIDEKEVYHIGASLKDLGKKLFGFSKMDNLQWTMDNLQWKKN